MLEKTRGGGARVNAEAEQFEILPFLDKNKPFQLHIISAFNHCTGNIL